MCQNQKFFVCDHCGNLVGLIHNKGVPVVCCGEKMKELVPNTAEASSEKHLPVVEVSGNDVTVSVGSTFHPMEESHHISFIYLETQHGGQRKCLKILQVPKLNFTLVDDKPIAVYAYCNKHGLWKTEI